MALLYNGNGKVNMISLPLLLLITLNILRVLAVDYVDHVSSGTNSNIDLAIGDAIYSLDGSTRLKLGFNGQLVVQSSIDGINWTGEWGNGDKVGTKAVLAIQYDGNLVIYEYSGGPAVWSTGSNNAYPPQHLVVNNNGYAYMLNARNIVTWSTTGITTGLPTFGPPTAATTLEPSVAPTVTQTTTATPTVVQSSCAGQFYAGPIFISDSHSVGTVRIGDIMEVSFNFKVNSADWRCPSGWCHIFRIGPVAAGVRLPLISIDATDQHLSVSYEGFNDYNENGITNMFDGNVHSFYFKHTPTRNIFMFDGNTLLNITTAPYVNTEFGKGYDIWVCDQGNPYAADAVIWNLCVNSMGTTTTTTTTTTTSTTTTTTTTNEPSSNIPTTSVPSTNVPTTFAPTTDTPTSNFPTTAAPTTSFPTTNEPSSNIPTTSMPSTDAPTTAFPTTNVPSTHIPTTNVPTRSISDLSTNSPSSRPSVTMIRYQPTAGPISTDDPGEQSVEESRTTAIISVDLTGAAFSKSENASLTQQVIVIVALGTIIIIILLCLICTICIIAKKIKNKKAKQMDNESNNNQTDLEMHRVMSLSHSPSGQHITASSMSTAIATAMTPQTLNINSYHNNINYKAHGNVNEGYDLNEITTDLPDIPSDNENDDDINLTNTEPDNIGHNYVTKGGYVENNQFDNTPTGDDENYGDGYENNDDDDNDDHDGLYTKPAVSTPQYHMDHDVDVENDNEDDLYKKPVRKNRETLN